MKPTGFTPITADYSPIVPPPSISSLGDKDVEIINNRVLIPGEIINVSNNNLSVFTLSKGEWTLELNTSKAYLRPGDVFNLECKLSSNIGLPTAGISVIARFLPLSNSTLVDLPELAPTGKFDEKGLAKIIVQLGLRTTSGQKIQFVLHLSDSVSNPLFSIDTNDLITKAVYSNFSTVTTITSSIENTVQYKDPPTPVDVPVIPLHDVVVVTSTHIFKTYVIDQNIDLAPTNPLPRGSSGKGIYTDLNVQSPYNTGIHNRSPIEGIQNLLGSAFNELDRIQSWATEILGKAHSLIDVFANSELAVIKNLIPAEMTNAIDRYQAVIEEAGTYASDTAQTYLSDYANGNTINKTNAVMQHNVGQMRVQTSSTYTINSPSISHSAQQYISQSRFEHHASDLYQASHIHYWLRAEDQYTCMANTSARYNQSELVEYSANATYAAGSSTNYADTEINQIGQASMLPFHLTNSRSSNNDYGKSTTLVQRDYGVKSFLGSIAFNAQFKYSVSAGTDISFTSSKFSSSTVSNTSLQSSGVFSSRGESINSMSSAAVTTIDAPVVFINCGRSTAPVVTPPIIISQLPKVFEPMVDIAEYPRDVPVSVGPRGTRDNNTPEPGTTPEPTDLGQWLSRHST